MSDEYKLIQDTGRALRAKQLIENDLLLEAFRGLEEAYTAAWRSSLVGDEAAREKLYLAVNIVGKVRDHLTSIINNGKLADRELRELAQATERKKRWQDVR